MLYGRVELALGGHFEPSTKNVNNLFLVWLNKEAPSMGRKKRHVPESLPFKLYAIRRTLGLSQEQLLERLKHKDVTLYQGHISEYERGVREPPLVILLQYARVAGLPVDVLIDDEWDLPDRYMLNSYWPKET